MSSPDKAILPMNAQPFVRTFSYREVLSACTVSLIVLRLLYQSVSMLFPFLFIFV